jgi:hypothetical protein
MMSKTPAVVVSCIARQMSGCQTGCIPVDEQVHATGVGVISQIALGLVLVRASTGSDLVRKLMSNLRRYERLVDLFGMIIHSVPSGHSRPGFQ